MTYILCTDLDRTLIPNGNQPNDDGSILALHSLFDEIDLKLVYVSGRDINLIDQAIEQYQLPAPDFAITDVGSQIYQRNNISWQINEHWRSTLQDSWDETKIVKINREISSLKDIRAQQPEKQSKFKSSFYFSAELNITELNKTIIHIINSYNFSANIILSTDESTGTGLLDLIPKNASKNLALQFLAQKELFNVGKLVFSGDSGNDMSVFSSQFKAILVNNAEPDVKDLATKIANENNVTDNIYLAQGDFFGLNGNYCSGILEGMAYFFPELKNTILEQIKKTVTPER